MLKTAIKKIIPSNLLNQYHKFMAISANFFYGRPSEKMIVIGVTGTNGKSSTVMLIAKILEEAGYKVGATSTAIFKIAGKEWLNDKKMTMLGRFASQKLLRRMVDAGCRYAVIETSSQGIEQFRHWGINYDVAVFTNLTPEHIEAHGGFDNYKKAKEKLFARLKPKKQESKKSKKQTKKVIVANIDDEHAPDFLKYEADEKFGFSTHKNNNLPVTGYQLSVTLADSIVYNLNGVSFEVKNTKFSTKLFGRFNVYNCLAAIAVAKSQGISLAVCQKALEKVSGLPGRMEFIESGQNFKVLVDYAPEPESLKQLYQTINDHKIVVGRIIHVLGSCGGGRDVSRRPILGKMAGERADYVIVTNEDPYDDDPQEIIDQVAIGAENAGKILNQNLFKISDRREAIRYAFSLAKADDLVLLTGKGCEQAICVAGGKKIKWDEREVAREILFSSCHPGPGAGI